MTKMLSVFRVSLTELTEIKSSWYQFFFNSIILLSVCHGNKVNIG